MTTREGGLSDGPFASMNLGVAVGDDAGARRRQSGAASPRPAARRRCSCARCTARRVVRIGAADALPEAPVHDADASVTTEPGVACTVQVADCLPVLFAAPDGARRRRGPCRLARPGRRRARSDRRAACARRRTARPASSTPGSASASGRARFEVGADVLEAFGCRARRAGPAPVRPGAAGQVAGRPAGLARDRLAAAGVERVSAAAGCTVEDASRFFSYRRDGVTGRMAAAVWIARGPALG